ncbi:MAG: class II aldolase/adducin family protein [bacterium]|mgnify:CR=1 FL=1
MRGLSGLARELGREERGLAILGEGNVGAAASGGEIWVKASGTRMGRARPGDFLPVDGRKVLAYLDRRGAGREEDAAVMAALRACVTRGRVGQPSTETFLHALCLLEGGARWVGHTHPVGLMGLLCSRAGARPFRGSVFPDEIVYCGAVPAVVPYVDPGVKLAHALRAELRRYRRVHGAPPRLVLLVNHGIVALGATADEVLNVTLMAEKWARVLLGAFAAGGPRFLRGAQARHIDRWPAEHYRRRLLLTRR